MFFCPPVPLHSMRILPHYQDTGGFFVAVLKKHHWLPWQKHARERETANQVQAGIAGETGMLCHNQHSSSKLFQNVGCFSVCLCACADDQIGGSGIISPPTELLGQLDSGTCPPLDACHSFDTCGDGDEGSIGNGENLPEICGDVISKDDGDRQEATDNMEVDRPSVQILGR